MSGIKKITEKNMSKLMTMIHAKSTMLLIYSESCIHCQIFHPQWAEAAKTAAKQTNIKKNFQMLEIEHGVLTKLHEKNPKLFDYICRTKASQDIYFPKVMVFLKKGERIMKQEYHGERDKDAIIKYLVAKLPKEDRVAHAKTVPKAAPKSRKTVMKLDDSFNLEQKMKERLVMTEEDKSKSLHELIDQMLSKYLHM